MWFGLWCWLVPNYGLHFSKAWGEKGLSWEQNSFIHFCCGILKVLQVLWLCLVSAMISFLCCRVYLLSLTLLWQFWTYHKHSHQPVLTDRADFGNDWCLDFSYRVLQSAGLLGFWTVPDNCCSKSLISVEGIKTNSAVKHFSFCYWFWITRRSQTVAFLFCP